MNWTLVVSVLVLAGCAPDTIEGLKNDPGTTTEFDVPTAPRQVVANEVEMFGKCMQYGWNDFNRTNARPSFDAATGVYRVALTMHGDTEYWGLVEITPAHGGGSHVRTYTPHFPDNRNFGRWAKSAALGVQPCSGSLF
ncbi:MAG: hypothetical protein ACREHF_14305 [Rhizomicrobium sp.]